jgi:hypothetical protein
VCVQAQELQAEIDRLLLEKEIQHQDTSAKQLSEVCVDCWFLMILTHGFPVFFFVCAAAEKGSAGQGKLCGAILGFSFSSY